MSPTEEPHIARFYRNFPDWAALGLVTFGIAAGLATFAILTGLTPITLSEELIWYMLVANGVLALLMLLLILYQMIMLFVARARGTLGAGLHIRLISLFSIVAVVPALLVALFASMTLNRGLDSLFSERTQSIVNTAAKVAEGRTVNAHVNAMVVPGSGLVKEQAEAEGLDKIFVKAGFEWREPGCSMCLAMNPDKLSPEERCASTSNRNFEGRQGFKGRTHLVSPAMAAAAAIAGHFVDIREWR